MPENKGKVLLPIARAAISRSLGITQTADESAPWLTEPAACFVTLTQFGELRGCIGSLEAHRSLLADLKSNAVSAALNDPRFMPLDAAELGITRIEISLVTPALPMEFASEADALAQLRPNIDGVIFEFRHPDTLLAEPADCGRGGLATIPAPKGFASPSHGRHYRSTFLPQVWEQLPTPQQFMAHLKRKAGLPENFWDEGIKLSRYAVTKFIEDNQ
jgi:AmmeMemoRadiSam system protein A